MAFGLGTLLGGCGGEEPLPADAWPLEQNVPTGPGSTTIIAYSFDDDSVVLSVRVGNGMPDDGTVAVGDDITLAGVTVTLVRVDRDSERPTAWVLVDDPSTPAP